jgi:hypothetical protein
MAAKGGNAAASEVPDSLEEINLRMNHTADEVRFKIFSSYKGFKVTSKIYVLIQYIKSCI